MKVVIHKMRMTMSKKKRNKEVEQFKRNRNERRRRKRRKGHRRKGKHMLAGKVASIYFQADMVCTPEKKNREIKKMKII